MHVHMSNRIQGLPTTMPHETECNKEVSASVAVSTLASLRAGAVSPTSQEGRDCIRICTYVYVYVYAYVGKNVGFNPTSIGAGFNPTSTGVGTNMGFNPMSIGVGINPTSSDDMNDETTLYEYCHIRPGPSGNEPNPDPNPNHQDHHRKCWTRHRTLSSSLSLSLLIPLSLYPLSSLSLSLSLLSSLSLVPLSTYTTACICESIRMLNVFVILRDSSEMSRSRSLRNVLNMGSTASYY